MAQELEVMTEQDFTALLARLIDVGKDAARVAEKGQGAP
jgi:hypothetical protein